MSIKSMTPVDHIYDICLKHGLSADEAIDAYVDYLCLGKNSHESAVLALSDVSSGDMFPELAKAVSDQIKEKKNDIHRH